MCSQTDSGKWVKLSYDLSEDVPLPPGMKGLSWKFVQSIDRGDHSHIAMITTWNHVGTHMDAPLHFSADGYAITDFGVEEFCFSRPIVVDIPLADGQLVTPEHLQPYESAIAGSDLLLIRTGFGKIRPVDPERYRLFGPGFSASAASYIAEKFPRLRGLGMDTVSLAAMQEEDEGVEAHRILLGNGRRFLLIEDLNLDLDADSLCEIVALPLLIDGIDGSPCTVIARIKYAKGGVTNESSAA